MRNAQKSPETSGGSTHFVVNILLFQSWSLNVLYHGVFFPLSLEYCSFLETRRRCCDVDWILMGCSGNRLDAMCGPGWCKTSVSLPSLLLVDEVHLPSSINSVYIGSCLQRQTDSMEECFQSHCYEVYQERADFKLFWSRSCARFPSLVL